MYQCPYPHLFAPIRLGKQWFRNRIFASPMSGRSLDSENRPTAECVAFYEEKARGGAASVCLGDCCVDSVNGLFGESMVRADDRGNHHAFNMFSNGISRYGCVASAELSHAGLYAYATRAAGRTVYGPVDGVTAAGEEFREMPEELIEATIARFADAAAFFKSCGFGMVTVHMGHGWGLSQFLSSKVNTRTDRWGGSLENRCRMPVAVLDAIRRRVGPAFPIEVRISGSEVTPQGYDLEEGIAIARQLDGHCDLLHVSAGHHEHAEVFCVTHPSIFSEDSCNVGYAAAIKPHVEVPVATVGAHGDPEILEEIIASGKADVVEIARALLADPELPNKARAGRREEIRPCLRCLTCFSHLITNGQIYCAVNPRIGRELEHRYASEAKEQKTVLIAGGGIGGMQAAVSCADRGHRVILCEKTDRLGGALLCEEEVPFKKKIKAYLEFQRREIARRPIDVRLNTPVTPALASEIGPDVILAALGARPSMPPIPGMDGKNVLVAEYAYRHTEAVGRKVAVLGGGLVGIELAIFLAGLGREVTVVEMLPMLNNGGNILHQNALDVEIKAKGIRLALGTRVARIDESGVTGEKDGKTEHFAADTVICAMGQTPLWEEADALRFCAPEFYTLGDCVTPRNIMQATAMADAIAMNI
ncbi:MAG: FAD-dependent oxidoreductase [Oscillospiraceae bacterium]|nr:FAD-dependent oxidoreductase [Oscillospiraceae bacterium]